MVWCTSDLLTHNWLQPLFQLGEFRDSDEGKGSLLHIVLYNHFIRVIISSECSKS